MNEVIKKSFGEHVNTVNVEFSIIIIILHTKLIIIIVVVTPLIIRKFAKQSLQDDEE